ncbi:MAG: hypothetical protein QOJ59_1707 [Thermomicrobiales bacterium]|nr:hypothetical protein [Thermomicrobiales bacterium]
MESSVLTSSRRALTTYKKVARQRLSVLGLSWMHPSCPHSVPLANQSALVHSLLTPIILSTATTSLPSSRSPAFRTMACSLAARTAIPTTWLTACACRTTSISSSASNCHSVTRNAASSSANARPSVSSADTHPSVRSSNRAKSPRCTRRRTNFAPSTAARSACRRPCSPPIAAANRPGVPSGSGHQHPHLPRNRPPHIRPRMHPAHHLPRLHPPPTPRHQTPPIHPSTLLQHRAHQDVPPFP